MCQCFGTRSSGLNETSRVSMSSHPFAKRVASSRGSPVATPTFRPRRGSRTRARTGRRAGHPRPTRRRGTPRERRCAPQCRAYEYLTVVQRPAARERRPMVSDDGPRVCFRVHHDWRPSLLPVALPLHGRGHVPCHAHRAEVARIRRERCGGWIAADCNSGGSPRRDRGIASEMIEVRSADRDRSRGALASKERGVARRAPVLGREAPADAPQARQPFCNRSPR